MTDASIDIGSDESVMSGGGYYSANSRPQHVAAEVAYPYLIRAVARLPVCSPPWPR